MNGKKYIVSLLFLMNTLALNAQFPTLSIIISLMHRPDLALKTIENISTQTMFGDCELLVFASSDYFLEPELARYISKYINIRYFRVLPTCNDAQILNFAIERSRGKYLTQIFPGDLHTKNAFEMRTQILEKNPTIACVYTNYWWNYEPHRAESMESVANQVFLPLCNPLSFVPESMGFEHTWVKNIHTKFGIFDETFEQRSVAAFWKNAIHKNALIIPLSWADYVHYIDLDEGHRFDYTAKVVQMMHEDRLLEKMALTLTVNKGKTKKRFVIIVPSYNNAFWYERNLETLLNQKYDSYRIMYIDDCSPDSTGTLVRDYLDQHDTQHRVTLICNQERKGCPLANIWAALKTCDADEIAVLVDGDDWLPHDQVLGCLNTIYNDRKVWLTYGQFCMFPFDTMGWAEKLPEQIIRQNLYRDHAWRTTHLRTFYVGLAQHIDEKDLLYEGKFYPMAGDLALMFPLLELAGEHSRFIPDILYVYNRANALNEDKVNQGLQDTCAKAARKGRRYTPLQELF